ncbi:MAG: hypothetical protein GZ091_13810 [Paludibacter sp.]|nr:hypothetical protein [Paludibacter sp.]
MSKITFWKSFILAFALVIGGVSIWGQGTETFTNSALTASYATGSFSGDNSVTWSYIDSRNVDTYGINGKGIMFEGAITAKLTSGSISGGINSFTCSLKKAFTGSGNRQVELFINGVSKGISIAWDNTTVQTFTVSNINISGNIIIEIRNKLTKQVVIDDISWTGLASSCTSSTLGFATPIVDKTMANVSYSQAATSLNATTPITYSSSNTAVAFNMAGGNLFNIATAGSTVITATQAAGTHNGVDYCSSTATYTLNVISITPTIIVTEVTIPNMTAYVGNTITETVNVSGVNLTGNITISIIDDTNNQFDEPSVTSITKLADNTATSTVTVTYRPTASGNHSATLKLESTDATTITRALSGNATWTPLATPVATDASASNATGFTANWNVVAGATEYQLDVYTKAPHSVSDLIISEYVEGSSYNKAIEIYNGTGSTVDLSNYTLKKQINGAGAYGSDLVLSGNLADKDVYVIAYVSGVNSAIAEIIVVTDLQTSISAINYNGNDAVALFKGSIQIDEVGIFDQVANWGTDLTLIRKSSVAAPQSLYVTTEWVEYPKDYIANLGTHISTVATPITGSPFTATATSKAVTGLDAGTTYYYTVTAKNTNVTSAVSNEMIASTLGTGLGNNKNSIQVTVANGTINFSAIAGEAVKVYNAVGQKLVSKLTTEGINSIPVSAKGVVLVKVGNRFAKVIL